MADNPKISQIKLPNGSTYDIKDNTSGYITGITSSDVTGALGFTPYNSTNPNGYTNNIGTITSVKTTAGAHTTINVSSGAAEFNVPTKTSHLTNDSGFITAFVDEKLAIDLFSHSSTNSAIYYPILGKKSNSISAAAHRNYDSEFKYEFINGTTVDLSIGSSKFTGRLVLKKNGIITRLIPSATTYADITLPAITGTIALTSDIPTIPTNVSAFTNDAGYLTSSDIASVLTYKGTKASVANLPSTGNTTGDVWHITADGSEYAWDGSIWQELGTAIDLSGYAQLSGASFTGPVTFGDSVTADELNTGDLVVTGAASFTNNIQANTINGVEVGNSPKFTDTVTTVSVTGSGNAVTAASASNGVVTLTKGATFLTSYTETDPVFSASAAASITSTDISNWNAKVSDDKTWNGVELNLTSGISSSEDLTFYIPGRRSVLDTTAYQVRATSNPSANRIAKYDINSYLYSTTPSANDNSTKVATTAYVDAAIPDVSGFSTTDEKLKLESVNANISYHPILTTGNTIDVASTKFTDLYGISYGGGNEISELTLGNNTSTTESTGRQGRLTLYGTGTFFSRFLVGTLTANSILTLPNKTGTLALTSDIPKVYSSTNTGGYLTMATLPIYDGTVV